MIGIQQARPPFVTFKQVAIEDPKRSVELGYRVTRDVDRAYVMQPGSKDCLEIDAKDWLASIKRKNLERTHDSFPDEWVTALHKKYEAWKDGLEAPLNGTSVKEWPILSPAQAQNFIAIGVLTIEDVAAMTEEAMGRVGMGGRSLRNKARDWIKTREMANGALEENEKLKKELAELREEFAAMKAASVQPYPKKRGRPAKDQLAA
jgi:hypothetical protein